MRGMASLLIVVLSACAVPGGPYPSLQPRAAEAIDPRLPVVRPMNTRGTSAALASKLGLLMGQANDGAAAFDSAASEAERLASAGGAPQSESWIAAQEALTAAIAARKPVTTALSDIDEIAATALQTQGGLAPNDLGAIQWAQAYVESIDEPQAARLDAIQKRLGL